MLIHLTITCTETLINTLLYTVQSLHSAVAQLYSNKLYIYFTVSKAIELYIVQLPNCTCIALLLNCTHNTVILYIQTIEPCYLYSVQCTIRRLYLHLMNCTAAKLYTKAQRQCKATVQCTLQTYYNVPTCTVYQPAFLQSIPTCTVYSVLAGIPTMYRPVQCIGRHPYVHVPDPYCVVTTAGNEAARWQNRFLPFPQAGRVHLYTEYIGWDTRRTSAVLVRRPGQPEYLYRHNESRTVVKI